MSQVIRKKEIARRRRRRAKILKIRAKLAKVKSAGEAAALVEKIRKISPLYPVNLLQGSK